MKKEDDVRTRRFVFGAAFVLAALLIAPVHGQVGKGSLMDFNVAAEKDLAALPGMTPAMAKAIVDKRPFASITDVNALLLAQGLTAAQATAIYDKAFIHLDLNTCTLDEIGLIPRAARMKIEYPEYRPWKTFAQFDANIGKYVRSTPGELDRLRSYVFIAMNVNAATDDDLMTIPGMTPKTLGAIKQGRPWKTREQFATDVAKASNAKEAGRVWRYLVIQ